MNPAILQRVTDEYAEARDALADRWVPACGGHEVPFLDRLGRTVLYVFNPGTREHAYLDTTTDVLMARDYDPQRGF